MNVNSSDKNSLTHQVTYTFGYADFPELTISQYILEDIPCT
jgi:hypothetical protein